ncbi:mitotic spindle assembly checkpoint protein MAD1-like isoform X2 [Tachypleus tridentatus]|uniref:mitotic spindle assembly checkpoint protein MAD1-like isoform X2 n=1 Tax=Tachypleus tridentatus TaxID=6853 RepID=UPI003FD0AC1D
MDNQTSELSPNSPKDNSQVVRMMNDFSDLLQQKTPHVRTTSKFGLNLPLTTDKPRFSAVKSSYNTSKPVSCSASDRTKLNRRETKTRAVGLPWSRSSISTKLSFVSPKPHKSLDKAKTLPMKISGQQSSVNLGSLQKTLESETLTCKEVHDQKGARESTLEKEVELMKQLEKSFSILESSVEPLKKRACVELEIEMEKWKTAYEREAEKFEKLKDTMRRLVEKQTKVESELNDLKERHKTEQEEHEKRLLSSQRLCKQLEADINELEAEKSEIIQELHHKIERLQGEVKASNEEVENVKNRVELAKKHILKEEEMKSNMKLEEATQKIKELEDKLSAHQEDTAWVQGVQKELSRMVEMENENQKLKEDNRILRELKTNSILLHEKLEDFQKQQQDFESMKIQLTRIQEENVSLTSQLHQWKSLESDKDSCETISPSQVSRHISQLQKNVTLLKSEVIMLNGKRQELENNKLQLNEKITKLTNDLENTNTKLQLQDHLIKRLQKKLLLVSKERDSYKRVIDSYESEVTVAVGPQMERILWLESVLAEYRVKLDQTEAELNQAREQLLGNLQPVKKSEASTQTEGAALSVQQDHSQMKIVHFKNNPLDLAIQTRIDDLRQENMTLKAKLEQLTQDKPSTSGSLPCQEKHDPSSDAEGLKEQLTAAELKNKRLVNAFRRTSQEFREVCYLLTGFKIDVSSQNKYKMSHMYSESENDYLLFEYANGRLKLLETEYSSQLQELIDTYLKGHNSIPAFLSSLTLELFSQQTYFLDKN